jgi:DNA helicase-2/ATP-dependent DNA helicase PcrA
MIKVMTIHGAKGLEFKYVFLVNMVDKRFPTIERGDPIELPEEMIRDIKPTGDVHLQEERRICYVAMTRAKKELYFTSAQDYGLSRKKKLSRFMIEMGYKDEAEKGSKKSKSATAEMFEAEPQASKEPKEAGKSSSYQLPDHFSYSQLAAFQKCPLQYKFAFILRIPVRGKAMFSFGKTMHDVFYRFLKLVNEVKDPNQSNLFGFNSAAAVKSKSSDFKTLAEIYEKAWVDDWYENKAQREEYYKLGQKIIKDFYDDFVKNQPKILKIDQALALEMPFNLKIGGYTLNGRIDRIDETKGGVGIVDYKTGAAKEKLDADDKEQLLIYQIAAEEVLKLKPEALTYYYVNEYKKASFLGSDKDKQALKEKIVQEIEEIKKSDFGPKPGWQCSYCDFKEICEYAQR